MNLLLYEDEMPKNIETEKEEPEPSVPDDPVPERLADIGEEDKSITYNYIGILEISKLGIKKGFLNLESPYNNVNKNVTLIEYSTMPDVENGNLILAAHSGNCWVCYFDKLYMLSVGDKAAVTYNGYKYTYELKNIYNVPKTGTVEVRRDPSKTVLTLITCTRGSDTEQTVYIFEENCNPEEIRYVEFFTHIDTEIDGTTGRWGIYYGEGNIYIVPWEIMEV